MQIVQILAAGFAAAAALRGAVRPTRAQQSSRWESPNPGVVYFLPESTSQIESDLCRINGEGYKHVNVASWVWTLPHRGSELRRRVDFLLNWADRNGMGVWLMHHIQYGNPRESGDIEAAFGDPAAYARPVVDPWIDALRGHPSVLGVQLGNEVAPHVPDAGTSPR